MRRINAHTRSIRNQTYQTRLWKSSRAIRSTSTQPLGENLVALHEPKAMLANKIELSLFVGTRSGKRRGAVLTIDNLKFGAVSRRHGGNNSAAKRVDGTVKAAEDVAHAAAGKLRMRVSCGQKEDHLETAKKEGLSLLSFLSPFFFLPLVSSRRGRRTLSPASPLSVDAERRIRDHDGAFPVFSARAFGGKHLQHDALNVAFEAVPTARQRREPRRLPLRRGGLRGANELH